MNTDHLREYKQRAQQMGIDLMLTKPVQPSALLNLLLELLQHHRRNKGISGVAAQGQSTEKPLPNMKVLIAEDDNSNQILVSHMMQRWGLDYTIVENGQEAVLLVQHQHFDLLLMDVNMPVMDGLEATRRIRAHEVESDDGHHLPIVALTALAFAEDEQKCLAAGMDAFLTKPIRRQALSEMVWQMIDDGVIVLAADNSSDPHPLFDRQQALELNDGDEALLEILVQALHDDLSQQLKVVGKAVDCGQCDQVMRTAHKLKGALATLGITAVSDIALELEKAGREGDLTRCDELFQQLEVKVEQLQVELSTASAAT